jgi:NADH-quinone oxidoreductase subunit M
VLLGSFGASWQQYEQGSTLPLFLSASAVTGVVLGALYMLWLAQRLLFGAVKAPHQPFADLDSREVAILGIIVVAVFALGLFPDEPMRKTEIAAKEFQRLVSTPRTGAKVAADFGAAATPRPTAEQREGSR